MCMLLQLLNVVATTEVKLVRAVADTAAVLLLMTLVEKRAIVL